MILEYYGYWLFKFIFLKMSVKPIEFCRVWFATLLELVKMQISGPLSRTSGSEYLGEGLGI